MGPGQGALAMTLPSVSKSGMRPFGISSVRSPRPQTVSDALDLPEELTLPVSQPGPLSPEIWSLARDDWNWLAVPWLSSTRVRIYIRSIPGRAELLSFAPWPLLSDLRWQLTSPLDNPNLSPQAADPTDSVVEGWIESGLDLRLHLYDLLRYRGHSLLEYPCQSRLLLLYQFRRELEDRGCWPAPWQIQLPARGREFHDVFLAHQAGRVPLTTSRPRTEQLLLRLCAAPYRSGSDPTTYAGPLRRQS
jgi:hypothetical protein